VAVELVRSGHARIDIRGVSDSTPDDDFRLKWLKELVGAQLEAVTARSEWWGKEDLYRASDLAIGFIKFWGRDEIVYIVNRGKESVNLDGIILEDRQPKKNQPNLGRLIGPRPRPLPAKGLLPIHSGPAIKGKTLQCTEKGSEEIDCYWIGNHVWNNDEDEATLRTEDGKVIYKYVYKGKEG